MIIFSLVMMSILFYFFFFTNKNILQFDDLMNKQYVDKTID
jgi:nitrogen fixation-related uncharacterized protein